MHWRTERGTRMVECSGRQHKAYGECVCMHTHWHTHTHTRVRFDQEQSATFPQRINLGKHGSRFTLLLLCPFCSTEDQEETRALVQFSFQAFTSSTSCSTCSFLFAPLFLLFLYDAFPFPPAPSSHPVLQALALYAGITQETQVARGT